MPSDTNETSPDLDALEALAAVEKERDAAMAMADQWRSKAEECGALLVASVKQSEDWKALYDAAKGGLR